MLYKNDGLLKKMTVDGKEKFVKAMFDFRDKPNSFEVRQSIEDLLSLLGE